MPDKLNILVSGCGGDIGQSIGKILQKWNNIFNLFGIDISTKNAGKFIFDNFSIGLPINDTNYLENLSNYINQNKIDIYIPIAEPELRFFSEIQLTDKIGDARMITANLKAMHVGFDKYETSEFLRISKLPSPVTLKGDQFNNIITFPFILKSRVGSGSKKLFIVENENDFKYFNSKLNLSDYVIQELLPDNDGEFTCGLFRSSTGDTRSITFKRELSGGYSGYGEIIENEKIDSLLNEIAIKLDLKGSINVQLRIRDEQPVVFEINPRFSSTVLFRSLFGFDDVIWSIQDALNLPISEYKRSIDHKYFYKGFSEYID
jgi:carbamoyl-phosphate synthase large subunit